MNYIYTLLLFVCFSSYSQNTFIGKIIDKESNEPVIGASIRILDSNNGTFSNENGEFQIILNGNNKSLTITYPPHQVHISRIRN
jgi:iron complex outermembrane receptor protein